jgi:hypothetical protein
VRHRKTGKQLDTKMKIIRTLGKTEYGGSCANCNGDYTSNTGFRCLCEWYEEDNGLITEPMNLCYACYHDLGGERV